MFAYSIFYFMTKVRRPSSTFVAAFSRLSFLLQQWIYCINLFEFLYLNAAVVIVLWKLNLKSLRNFNAFSELIVKDDCLKKHLLNCFGRLKRWVHLVCTDAWSATTPRGGSHEGRLRGSSCARGQGSNSCQRHHVLERQWRASEARGLTPRCHWYWHWHGRSCGSSWHSSFR